MNNNLVGVVSNFVLNEMNSVNCIQTWVHSRFPDTQKCVCERQGSYFYHDLQKWILMHAGAISWNFVAYNGGFKYFCQKKIYWMKICNGKNDCKYKLQCIGKKRRFINCCNVRKKRCLKNINTRIQVKQSSFKWKVMYDIRSILWMIKWF